MKKLLLCVPVMLFITGSLYSEPAYSAAKSVDTAFEVSMGQQPSKGAIATAFDLQSHLFQINASHSVAIACMQSELASLMDSLSTVSKDAIEALPIIQGLNELCDELESAEYFVQDSIVNVLNNLYIFDASTDWYVAVEALPEREVADLETSIQSRFSVFQNKLEALKIAVTALHQESIDEGVDPEVPVE